MFQPVWISWNNYSTKYGFYEEPEDTIETIFLGSSRAITAFIPTELYRDFGICSYNLSTESQPVMASYYLTKEAYQKHSGTLKTVVFECFSMFGEDKNLALYQKAIDITQFPTKLQAVMDYPVDDKEKLFYLFPLFEYHSRWSSLTKDDFRKAEYHANLPTRGYLFVAKDFLDSKAFDGIPIPPVVLDENAKSAEFNPEALEYFEKLVDFCEEKDIKLVLTSTTNNWSADKHHAISFLAEKHGLDYIDFNEPSIFESLTYNLALDMYEANHTNYYGASKMTSYMGMYLKKECKATDRRGDLRFSFMENELRMFQDKVTDVVKLKETASLCSYLDQVRSKNNYTAFLMVKDSGVSGLDEATKESLAAMGFTGLKDLEVQEPYVAVLKEGEVVYERPKAGKKRVEETITYTGRLNSDLSYTLESGGYSSGNVASCKINGKEYAPNKRGINIVVYDTTLGELPEGAVADTAVFDTHVSNEREAGYQADLLADTKADGAHYTELSHRLKNLSLYNYRCKQAQEGKERITAKSNGDFKAFLKACNKEENCLIFLTEKNGEDFYRAVISGGTIIQEEKEADPFGPDLFGVYGFEKWSGGDGMKVTVYDTMLNRVIDSAFFDIGDKGGDMDES